MKKLLIMLAALTILALPALAEATPEAQIVGRQQSLDGVDLAILRIDFSDPGRAIPSVYAVTESPWLVEENAVCEMQDVNFDGHDDLVVTASVGASNAAYTFFLWNEESGAFEWYGGEPLWNYQLYPAQRMILSHITSGWAGLLHSDTVYAWDAAGRSLTALRFSEWDTLTEITDETRDGYLLYNELHDDSMLVETYVDYEMGVDESFLNAVDKYDDPDFMTQRFLYEANFLQLEVTPEANGDGSNG